MAEERKQILKQRFSKRDEQAVPKTTKAKPKAERGRHSLYLDNALVGRVDKAYKDVAHALYPLETDKADFIEACLAYALEHLDEIKAILANEGPQSEG